jgi:broad specificity phosphatase PhoE
LNSGANLCDLVTILLLPWPNQTKIESLQESGGTSIWKTVPGWTIWNGEVPGGETATQVATRLDRVVARVRESGVDQAICFGHGHALRALTMRWLGFELSLGVHFPLDTGTVSVLGEDRGEPALERWNARP